jgi:hypothetical protein
MNQELALFTTPFYRHDRCTTGSPRSEKYLEKCATLLIQAMKTHRSKSFALYML